MRSGGTGATGGGGAAAAFGAALVTGTDWVAFCRGAVARAVASLTTGFARVVRTSGAVAAGTGTIAGSTGGVAVTSKAAFFWAAVRLARTSVFSLVGVGTASPTSLPFVALAGADDGTSGKGVVGSGLGASSLASAAGAGLVERLDRPAAERSLGAARLVVGRASSGGAVGLEAISEETVLTLVARVLTGFGAGVAAGFAVATAGRLGRADAVAGRVLRALLTLGAAAAGAARIFAGAILAVTFTAVPPVPGWRAARLVFAGGGASDLPGIGSPTGRLARVVLRLEAEVLFVCGFMAPLGWGG